MVYDPAAAHVPDEELPDYGARLAAAKASMGLPVDFVFEKSAGGEQSPLPARRYYRGENYDGDPRY